MPTIRPVPAAAAVRPGWARRKRSTGTGWWAGTRRLEGCVIGFIRAVDASRRSTLRSFLERSARALLLAGHQLVGAVVGIEIADVVPRSVEDVSVDGRLPMEPLKIVARRVLAVAELEVLPH